ncbi:MAG TPA: S9 family peptidase [Pyrinomonadaceae bacterium]|jgi:dipeptidyl aminopeptidase/acylaminoacyl peptidase|nr:S9 family peptidase [Pyrinomonadaceae bacterium]
MKRFPGIFVILLALASLLIAQERRFTVDDLLKVRRVGDPQVSPKNDLVAFTITDMDKAANKGTTQIYLVPLNGGEMRQLTNDEHSSASPRWSPDGEKLAFVSAREGEDQIWTIDVSSGALKKISSISTGAGDPVWSPDGNWIAFVSDVYPECKDDACNKKRADERAQSKVKPHVADRLLFRHWKSWKDGMRSHIFVVSAQGGEARDLTPGDYDAPPFSLGGMTDYAFSADSKELAFASNHDKVEATSTNGDIWIVPVRGGAAKNITAANHGYDGSPRFSSDGRFIAYRSQVTPGYESDRFRLMLYDRKTGRAQSLTESLDSWVDEYTFSPDSQTIYLTAEDRGRNPIYSVSVSGGPVKKVLAEGFNGEISLTRDGRSFVFSRSSMTRPSEIYRANIDGTGATALTTTNDALISAFKLQPAEEVTWTGALGAKVAGWIVKPANFSARKKYPLVVLIHGGPQGAWNDNWGYRWNPQVWANNGYVAFMPNPRGSTGYGQRFLSEISGDWGGKVFVDISNGVAMAANLPYVDKTRIGAAGASYGGYMIDWIEGHNNDPRFHYKVLVSHDGVYNLTAMYGATEELWFPEWEFKGTPWTNKAMYERWSPHNFVQNFKTPILVITNDLDFRVPVTEGLQMFTAVQRMGVESKLVDFSDEGHWVQKPGNSAFWYNTVLDWLDKHLK